MKSGFSPIKRIITGGISRFWFVPVWGVAAFPDGRLMQVNVSDIVLMPDVEWLPGFADHNSLKYSEGLVKTPHGVRVEASLSGFLPDDFADDLEVLQSSFNEKYIVRFRTHQGQERIVGTLDNGCSFSFELTSAVLGDRKGSSFSFEAVMPRLAFVIKNLQIAFSINAIGELVQIGENADDFTINSDGELVVTGPGEDDYEINNSGQLIGL
jgi:hypothetical protein